ncbi:Calcineurin-like phosphoesterase, partial [Globisporangium splendens]
MVYTHADALAFGGATTAREKSEFDVLERPTWRNQFDQPVARKDDAMPQGGLPDASDWVRYSIGANGVSQHVKLHASPARLADGEDLVITWSDVEKPHEKDFLGLSCGPTRSPKDILTKRDVDQQDAATNSVRFSELYMMRCNYTVVYYNFQPEQNDHVAIGTLEVGMKESFNVPKHGHIALTEKQDEMAVMFNSASQRTPKVKYGLTRSELTSESSGTSTTYTAADMCEAPANITSQVWFRDPGFMHKVFLRGLASGKMYFYQFGNDEDGWSAVYSFQSRPDPSVKTAKFIAYADMGVDGGAPSATSTAVRVYQDVLNGYDGFLLHFGDISYARGHGHIWDQFFHLIEPYATRIPYMVSIGNHEYDYLSGGNHDPSGAVDPHDGGMTFRPKWGNFQTDDSSGECSVPMFHRWHAPANGRGIYWYSFDYGGVHVIQMSSEHDWTRGSEQYKWLEADLKAVDREQTPWVVLTAHRMMYTTQLGELADLLVSKYMREEMEDLLWTYKVNAMLVGHQHSYERSCAVRNGKCTKDGVGPVHIIVGSAGAELETQGFSKDIGEWSVSHLNDWGYCRIETTEKEMTIQFVLNRNGAIYDEVTLARWD